MSTYYFEFERLDVYRLIKSVNDRLEAVTWPDAELKDQGTRAGISMQLNLAEGWGRGRHTKAGKNHFRIALGSAGEAFAVMQLVGGHEAIENDLRRIGSMLVGLAR